MRHVGKTSSPQPSARLAADFHPGGRLANAPGPGSPAPGSEKFGRQAALLLWSPSAELLVTDWPRNAAEHLGILGVSVTAFLGRSRALLGKRAY
jgi:hypothetical protein